MQHHLNHTIIKLTAILFLLVSCHKQEFNRFPLADKYYIDGEKLTLAFNEFKKVEGALSLIVCRNGQIVAEEYTNYQSYGADSIKNIMSVTKTITGVLAGLAIDKGYIESLHDPIKKYLTGIVTFPDEVKGNITIEQLLKMSFGHAWNGTSSSSLFVACFHESEDNLQYIIDLPLVTTPGTVFNYSDGASHLLSAIISQATGMSTLDFAAENLFDPIGITEYEWSTDDRGYHLGAAYLRIKPRDMIRFGNLILNKGVYGGRQVVPESWINEMTTAKISTNDDIPYGPEYGYQIWLGTVSGNRYYMAIGWGGQFIVIVPGLQLVVAATCWTGGISDRQAGEHWMSIIKIVMEKIIPAVH